MAARRILVIRLDNLGDVLLATPAIRAIRRALPNARLTLLASPTGAQIAPLVPDLDEVIVYRAPWMDPDRALPFDPGREASMVAQLRRHGFDAAVIFTSYHQSSLPAAFLCYQAGVPLRHAASVDGPGSLLTTRHRHPNRVMHEVERGLDLVGGVGIPASADDLVLEVPNCQRETMREFVRSFGDTSRPVVAFHPGCTCPARTYPPDLFAKLADALYHQLGAHAIWTGTASERPLIDRIQSLMETPSVSVAGKTNLTELSALLAECDLVVSNNTGPMHVTAAVKTPILAMFALTNPPEEWHPWKVPHRLIYQKVDCAICYQRICPTRQECLRDVPLPTVIAAAADLLDDAQSSRGTS